MSAHFYHPKDDSLPEKAKAYKEAFKEISGLLYNLNIIIVSCTPFTYYNIQESLVNQKRKNLIYDTLIANIYIENEIFHLFTANKKDFTHIKDLVVITP